LFKGIPMRMAFRLSGAAAVLVVASLLQGCGGGGGASIGGPAGSGGSIDTGCFANSEAPAATPVSNLLVGTGSVVVSGTAQFASVPSNNVTGALNYAAIVNKPVRGATLEAESAGVVLARTTTNDQGAYSLKVPANTIFNLRLRPELVNASSTATWNVVVRDNTVADKPQLSVVTNPTSSAGVTSMQLPIVAGSGWNGSSYDPGKRAAAPFAILDTIYTGMKLVTSVQPSTKFPALTVYWSPKNLPADGDPTLGEIQSSHFSISGTCANPQRDIFVLGKEDVDTDEYDSSVVAHEYGHYLQSAFSTDHSLGGQHGTNEKVDMTLAFSEGWGNAFSSMARNDPIYADSSGAGQTFTTSFTINMANPPGVNAISRGWYGEASVGTSLYAFFVSQGFAPTWNALTGPMKTSQDALATIFSFADAVRSVGNSALNGILTAQNIYTGPAANQWGQGETNNGGDASNLPIYRPLTLGAETQVCFITSNLRSYGVQIPVNKLGTWRYFRISLPAAGTRTITSSFPTGGHDIDFQVFQKGALRGEAGSAAPTSEVGSLNLAAGETVIRVMDFNVASVAANAPCATIRID
jgi:hypothetical protein